jgi:multisubunit Na+/H+ antiporter MnhB subunit
VTAWAFDAVVVGSLLWLAWRAITARKLRVCIVTFLPYGLVMAIAWARLEAPDVAIAEAAIGGGLTSALLLAAARRVREPAAGPDRARSGRRRRVGAVAVAGTVAVAGSVALLSLPQSVGLGPRVETELEASGVGNPVTAVLLNFRAYDTLLEIAVLVLALIAVQRIRPGAETGPDASRLETTMLDGLVRFFLPAVVVTGGYLLWRGADEPGGAFQAGAVLAGGGVIALVAGVPRPSWLSAAAARWSAVLGLGVFGAVGAAVMVPGGELLEYPTGWSKQLILVIETAATVSVASVLVTLFAAVFGAVGTSRPAGER